MRTALTCPRCQSPMQAHSLSALYERELDIDACANCHVFWFDAWESSQLSADGIIALFQLIHDSGGTSSAKAPGSAHQPCPRCRAKLKTVQDRVKTTRFVYQSCPKGHGRLTSFHHFLAEKQFIRELTPIERSRLSATLHQVRCSACAAPINLSREDACSYCHAPITILDRNAAMQAIERYLKQRNRPLPDMAVVKAMLQDDGRRHARSKNRVLQLPESDELVFHALGNMVRQRRLDANVPGGCETASSPTPAAGVWTEHVQTETQAIDSSLGQLDLVSDAIDGLLEAIAP